MHSGGLRESGGSSWESVGSGGRCPDGGPRNLTLDSGGNSTELVLYGCAPMLSFDDAEAWCVSRGGHLPSVRSEEELGAMAAIVGPVSGFCQDSRNWATQSSFGQECTVWTGLHKLGSSGGCSWRWTDAPDIDYGQPWPDFIHIDVSATELDKTPFFVHSLKLVCRMPVSSTREKTSRNTNRAPYTTGAAARVSPRAS